MIVAISRLVCHTVETYGANMDNVSSHKSADPILNDGVHFSRYYELELSQVIDRFNSLENFRVQLGTFFGTANLTVLAIALSGQRAGLVLIAASILVVFVMTDRRFRRLALGYVYRGLQLQRTFAPKDPETFLQIMPGRLSREAQMIMTLPTVNERKQALENTRGYLYSFFFLVPMAVIAGEVVTGISLWLIADWQLF
jgi:hypothetical protein